MSTKQLTDAENQTLKALLEGGSEKEIAVRLGKSVNSVHGHIRAIYRHFGVNARHELMAYCLRTGTAAMPVTRELPQSPESADPV